VIPDLDVASNLMLDRLNEPGAGFFINQGKLRKDAREIASAMGLDIDVRTQVAELGVAERQLIAIARAMAKDPKVLILDEPTSSLSATEAERLFKLLDHLRERALRSSTFRTACRTFAASPTASFPCAMVRFPAPLKQRRSTMKALSTRCSATAMTAVDINRSPPKASL
jgi:hypothetical protein